uniref:Uncharacterized protein n=1 Tax=Anopheles epiroticus TaxID=199890 RepID=A0A182PQR2_9DIPT
MQHEGHESESDSEASSVGDHLVNPNTINLDESFFSPTFEERFAIPRECTDDAWPKEETQWSNSDDENDTVEDDRMYQIFSQISDYDRMVKEANEYGELFERRKQEMELFQKVQTDEQDVPFLLSQTECFPVSECAGNDPEWECVAQQNFVPTDRKKTMEIYVSASNSQKLKRVMDPAEKLKRQEWEATKKLYLATHKTHLLLLLAYGIRINRTVNDQMIVCASELYDLIANSDLTVTEAVLESSSKEHGETEEKRLKLVSSKYFRKKPKLEQISVQREPKKINNGKPNLAKLRKNKSESALNSNKTVPKYRIPELDTWIECYLEQEQRWTVVEALLGHLDCLDYVIDRILVPSSYVFAWEADGTIVDVSSRYRWRNEQLAVKNRVDGKWLQKAIAPYRVPGVDEARLREQLEFRQLKLRAPFPNTIAQCKNHPSYCLRRHLQKFQAIYPPDAPPLGYVQGEPLYARECVHTLHSREVWLRHAKVIRHFEQPYKIVRTKLKRQPADLELFGYWQTEEYIPPEPVNGIVPRNAYGNIEIFKECMLPKGTVHLKREYRAIKEDKNLVEYGLSYICRKLGIDYAVAVVGFGVHAGGNHPVFDGIVICEEHRDRLLEAWQRHQEEAAQKKLEKKHTTVLNNWVKLVKGLLLPVACRRPKGNDIRPTASTMSSPKLTVSEVRESLQRFGLADYIVFVASLLICVVIGVYFGWKDWSGARKRKQNARRGSAALNYLVGGRKMKIFPVAMSLIASFISGIAVMGASTETYLHGTQFCYVFTAIILMAVSMNFIFLPVYQGLEITSAYAYLQLRFDRRIRLLGSGLFTLATLLHLPIVIYVPALAFNQVSGVNVHIVSTSVCMVCIFYTLVGGIKAVVWTDVIQMFIMIGALILIVIKGTADIGGLGVLIERNMASGRIEAPNFNFDPTERHTIWAIFIGGGCFWMGKNAIHQMMIQRYLALPTFRDAQKALVCFTVGIILLLMTCFYNGLLIYATFHDCDPLTTGLAKAKDQLIPVLLMRVLGNYPGLAGLFVSGIFSASLSSLSTGLNSLSAIVLEDFVKPFVREPLSERSTRYIMRGTVLAFGIVAVALVLIVEKLGTVLQLSMSLVPISLGPLLGMFLLGMLLPWVDSDSALGGAICGLLTMSYIVVRAQIAVIAKEMPIPAKPVSVEGCDYEFELPPGYNTSISVPLQPVAKSIHHVSYLYYTFIGAVTTVLVGSITAAILRRQQPRKLDPLLVAPFVRKIYFPESIPRTVVTTHTFDNKEDTALYVICCVCPRKCREHLRAYPHVPLPLHPRVSSLSSDWAHAASEFQRNTTGKISDCHWYASQPSIQGTMADVTTMLEGSTYTTEVTIDGSELFTTESAKRSAGPSVEDISRSLQRFNWPDYVVFVLMLISCMVIGVFFGYKDHQKHKHQKHARRGSEALDYLVGGRKMKIIPVSVSLVASWISGISLLGTSTEIYVYGVQYCYIVSAVVLMGLSMNYIFLPVFHDLQITSAYEYLQMRFDKRMRLVGSILFTLASILWLPIVIYVPALAFNQVSGVNIHVITPIVCSVCIFYTSLGGLKAVVWTDVIQTGIMVGAMIIVIIKGTADVGGLSVVIERNSAGGRFEPPDFNLDPTARNTFWTLLIGGTFFWTSTNSINQNMMQRYLSLPSLGSARKALVLFLVGTTTLLAMCCYNGLLIFAMYHDCDPLSTGLAKAKDQLVPLLVMEVLGEYPGLAGLFVAGIFSAALSSLSTALNSLSAIVLEDFCKPFVSKPLTETQTRYIMRFTVLAFGALAVMMVIVVEKMGAVLQLSMSLGPVTLGPLFGLFLMGFFFPRINGSCAIVGTAAGLLLMSYIVIRSQISIALKEIVFAEKPVTVEGCQYEFTPKNGTLFVAEAMSGEKSLHHVSFLYYTMIGSVVPTVVGYLASFILPKNSKTDDIDPLLLAPFLRRFYRSRDSKANHMTEVVHEFETKDIQLDWLLNGKSGEDYSNDEATSYEESEQTSGQTIDTISRSLQRFEWPDYVVFVLMLLICIVIGIFFGYKDHQKHKKRRKQPRRESEALDYLVGGRKMQIFPVSVSLVASWISGISLLGTSTEIYVYGTQYCYIVFAVILMGVAMHHVFLPVFHELQITSAYEYLQRRFDHRMRLFGSILFTVACLLWMPIVIYVPALAFNQVTGLSIHVVTPIVCMICVFYTSIGGLKAVVWTDVIQSGVTLLALLAVLIKGTYDVGGPVEIVQRNIEGDRLEAPIFNPDPTLRHSIWILLLGAPVWFCYGVSCSQDMIQRFLALPTLQDARKALKGFVIGWIVVNLIFFLIGMLVYATYYRCDPLTTQLAKAKDQLLPLFVMETFAAFPGMTGVFVAGIFSAALSSLSSALNALSAITLEDFFKPYRKKPLTERQTRYIMRGSVLVYGALSVLLSILVEHLGTVMQLTMTLSSASGAPLFGLFVMGILMPWVNGTGALYGGATGLLVMLYMCYKAQYSIASGIRTFDTKPVSVQECSYEYAINATAGLIDDNAELEQVEKSIYHISYMYFTLFGTSVTCLAGTVVSLISRLRGDRRDQPIDPKLLAPCIRRMQPSDIPLTFTAVPTDIKQTDVALSGRVSRLAGGTIDVPLFGTIMTSERTLKSNSGEEYSYYEAFHHVNSTIDSIGRSLQHFDWPDYVVFVWMLVVCIMIGILFGYRNHVKRKSQHQQAVNGTEAQDYLVGGRRMKIFPVAVSLVASWVSGVPMLGTATEIYVYGTQFCYIVFSMMVAGVLMNYLFLPVFHELQITSMFEILWTPIVIYVPAMAFNQGTYMTRMLIVGGLKAVVWTDVIQSGMMLLSLLAVLVKGTYDVGVLLSMLVEHLGTIMQLAMTLSSVPGAALFGLFIMGILMPWVNGTGALYGAISGLFLMLYMCYNAQYSIASGSRKFETKPVSVQECPYEYANNATTGLFDDNAELEQVEKSIYHISYLYFTLFGATVTCLISTTVSLISRLRGDRRDQPIDPKLLAPCIRRMQPSDIPLTFTAVPTDIKQTDVGEDHLKRSDDG